MFVQILISMYFVLILC